MAKRAELAAALILTFLAAALHALRLDHAGALWRDEAGAAQLAALPTWREIYEAFPHEAFPLLFPGTLRSWMALFGDSDLAFRVFGLLVGLAILAALWWNARLAGALPLVSIVLIQFHPAFPLYGDSVRGYGLGTLLILLTFGAFARLVDHPDRKSILLALLAATASVHLLLHNAALLAGIGASAMLVGLLRRRYRVTLAALGIGLVAALTLLPYAGPLRAAGDWRVLVKEKELTLGEVLSKLAHVIEMPFPWLVWVWCSLGLLALVVTIWRIQKLPPLPGEGNRPAEGRGGEGGRGGEVSLFRLLVVPAALGAQIAFLMVIGYSPRTWYILPVLALMASALDGLLAAGGPAPVRLARLTAAALLTSAVFATAVATARMRMTNVDRVAQAIDQSGSPGDLVVVNEWYMGVSFNRYYRGDTRWMTVPRIAEHRMHRFDLVKEKMQEADALKDVRRAMRRTLTRGGSIWVVGHLQAPPTTSPLWLPPAPQGPWGWRDGPYANAWTQQLTLFLEESTDRKTTILITTGGRVSGMEDLPLWRYWRTPPVRSAKQGREKPVTDTKRSGTKALDHRSRIDKVFLDGHVENSDQAGDGQLPAPGELAGLPIVKKEQVRTHLLGQQDGFPLARVQPLKLLAFSARRSAPDRQPCRWARHPIPDPRWSFQMSQLITDRRWNDDFGEQLRQNSDFFNQDQVAQRGCVGDNPHSGKTLRRVTASCRKSSSV